MLEDEKDKVSTWKEEQEELHQQLKVAGEKISVLEQENDALQKATEETSWFEYRNSLLLQAQMDQATIKELTEACASCESALHELEKEKAALLDENLRLKEESAGGSAWEKEKLSLKLTLAEKQNRVLELTSENDELHNHVEDVQTRLEEAQTEIEALTKQVDEVAWAEDRRALMQALEQEIDKRPMWEEERSSLEQQLAHLTEDIASLKAENATLNAACDEVLWAKEREELCRALEEEKEKLSSWTEEIEALEEENKELKWVFHETKEKNLVIRDKEEAIEHLNEQLENLQSRVCSSYSASRIGMWFSVRLMSNKKRSSS